jgi:hypothetical protein
MALLAALDVQNSSDPGGVSQGTLSILKNEGFTEQLAPRLESCEVDAPWNVANECFDAQLHTTPTLRPVNRISAV